MAKIKLDKDTLIISITDNRGSILYVNDDFKKYVGIENGELVGLSHDIFKNSDINIENMKKILEGEKIWKGFLKTKLNNNDHFWAFAIITKIVRSNNYDTYLCLRFKPTVHEISKHKKSLKNQNK